MARDRARCEYEQTRAQIQQADVVHVDETGHKLNGEQIWIWTFRTDQHTLYAVCESRGSTVPEEILGEAFGETIVCGGWTAYPAFSRNLQRCWAHILREAEYVADGHKEAVPIHRTLKQMYVGLQVSPGDGIPTNSFNGCHPKQRDDLVGSDCSCGHVGINTYAPSTIFVALLDINRFDRSMSVSALRECE